MSLTCYLCLFLTLESSWRSPSESWWGWGSEEMRHPLSSVQLRSTHCPPRLHTALQLGSKQQFSQHVAPAFPIARGYQPRVMALLQWIPSTPPVTRQRFADTPGRRQNPGCIALRQSYFSTCSQQSITYKQRNCLKPPPRLFNISFVCDQSKHCWVFLALLDANRLTLVTSCETFHGLDSLQKLTRCLSVSSQPSQQQRERKWGFSLTKQDAD